MTLIIYLRNGSEIRDPSPELIEILKDSIKDWIIIGGSNHDPQEAER